MNDQPDGLAGDKLVSGMRGKGWAMVHLPYGGTVEVDLAKTGQEGAWGSWWVDTKCGARSSCSRGDTTAELQVFTSPTEGSKNEDWLLVLEMWIRATCHRFPQ